MSSLWSILRTPNSPGGFQLSVYRDASCYTINLVERKTQVSRIFIGSDFLLGHSGNERFHVVSHLDLGRSVAFF